MKRSFHPLLIALALALLCLGVFAFRDKGRGKKIIFTDKAPKPIGPYSQAVMTGNTLYVSGQIALDVNGKMDTADIASETRRVLSNISEILKAAGMNENNVVKSTVFMKDLKKFSAMNEVYASYFVNDPPARETVEVNELPRGANIEISVVAAAN